MQGKVEQGPPEYPRGCIFLGAPLPEPDKSQWLGDEQGNRSIRDCLGRINMYLTYFPVLRGINTVVRSILTTATGVRSLFCRQIVPLLQHHERV